MSAAADAPTELELRRRGRHDDQAAAPVVDVVTRIDRLNSMKLADTYRELGIQPPPPIVETARWSTVRYDMTPDGSVRSAHRERDGVVVMDFVGTEPSEGAQESIGKVGTKITTGVIEVEQNFRLRPYQARGRLSTPGLFEEAYRVEPVAFKNVNEIAALIIGATYEPQVADDTDEDVRAEVARQHRAIARAMFNSDFLQNGSSFLKNGFAFFEQGWHEEDKVIDWFEFREPSTIYWWLFDDRQTKWLGTEFRVGGQGSETYIIPNGREMWSARTLLINLHSQGNNLEGISPLRLVVALRKMKELILQAFAIGYTKYAVPIATIVH
ncbi:MAG: hypothetical protein O7F08_01020, partial [Deltaproteobacteria bacterium]|nr:hypothetical protein [Deltaproteobacteria bacterium]